jgi:hypothetical protein
MDLTQLTSQPELTVTIDDRQYHFSELPIDSLAALQSWIRERHPHPIDRLKPHLAGLSDDQQDKLLERARVDGLNWPPQVGTEQGAIVLLSTEAGQVFTMHQSLLVHQPTTTLAEARKFYRTLRKSGKTRGDITVTRIFGTAFALDLDGATALPKA